MQLAQKMISLQPETPFCGEKPPQVQRLESAASIYFLPRDDVLSVLGPSIGESSCLDCMMGFFSSSSFGEIAVGLAAFLRASQQPMRLLISPFVTAADQLALEAGLTIESMCERRLFEGLPTATDLTRHTLACLAWLVREGRLEIRIALVRNGLFHPKVWLLNLSGFRVAFHGSSNLTGAGLVRNKEQLALSRAWLDPTQKETEQRIREEFSFIWSGDDDMCTVVPLPKAIEQRLLRDFGSDNKPEESSVAALWKSALEEVIDVADGPSDKASKKPQFIIPDWLDYRAGAFEHQGLAIDAWLSAQGRGVLAMATGSGKTLTALVGCHKLHTTEERMLLVIAAPYVPLVMQWCDEASIFGLKPRNLSGSPGGPAFRRRQIAEASRNLLLGLSTIEVLIVSHDILSDPGFQQLLEAVEATKVLVADEMHNLGTPSFLSRPPTFFKYRLGLSATPIRQYDPDGSAQLLDYFGQVCFEFSLEQAIGLCLVPYDYYIHAVSLTVEEMQTFSELSDQIRRLMWKVELGESDAQLDSLLRKRRIVVECAEGKLQELERILDQIGPQQLRYELIYATDKQRAQLLRVNALLHSRGVLYHQLTCEETVDRRQTAKILADFQAGELQVLTAKRVLDEGVNVPQIKRAFLLASTTVERQWVQRRGRILRKCEEIGKTFGIIHDFVVMPPPEMIGDDDARNLMKGELRRVEEFSRLARNYGSEEGPLKVLQELQAVVYSNDRK